MGTAAALAVKYGCSPRGVYDAHVAELQAMLMDDDCYLPWHTRPIAELSQKAALSASGGDPEPLRNGIDRTLGDADNGWWGGAGDWVEYRFAAPEHISEARFTFDSNQRSVKRMPCSYPAKGNHVKMPAMLARAFDIEAQDANGQWTTVVQATDNHQRLVKVALDVTAVAVRIVVRASWGTEKAHLFAFEAR
jgi:hypothetical protein